MEIVDSYNLPDYIKESELYKQLKQDEDDEFEAFPVPKKYVFDFNNVKLNSISDLDKLLDILRYWMVNRTPNYVYDFIDANYKLNYDEIFKKYYDFTLVNEIKYLINLLRDYAVDIYIIPMNQIVKTKYINMLKWAYETFEDKYKWGRLSLYNAIVAKNYEAVIFAHSHDAFMDSHCITAAIQPESYKILKYIYALWILDPEYKKNKLLTVLADFTNNEQIKELIKNESTD